MTEQSKNELIITRIFDAPVETVWKYWTVPEYFMRWWGPKYFTSPFSKIDFRVSGKYLFCMRGSDGKDYWSTGTYKEIIPMKKIVVTDSFADKDGNVVPSTYYGMTGFPTELDITITFEEINGKTKTVLHYFNLENIDDKSRKDMEQGWNESFDKIDQDLAKFKKE